ncbi:Cyclin-dependent kinase 2 [Ceratobasidium sp. 428]|nr:Cyclin-dependent kinase 2 [Ceratobasidium sp. 428]
MAGSLGQFFKAADRDTGQVVAFKKMKFHLKKHRFRGWTMREISNVRELKHKYTTRVLNIVYADTGTPYLVMEHLEMDLSRLVQFYDGDPDRLGNEVANPAIKYMIVVQKPNEGAALPVPLMQLSPYFSTARPVVVNTPASHHSFPHFHDFISRGYRDSPLI